MKDIIAEWDAEWVAKQELMLDSVWSLGFRDRGMGAGDFAVITRNGRKVVECPSREVAEHIIESHNNMLDVTSYPIYIIDHPNGENQIIFPKDKVDINHTDFWEEFVCQHVCDLYGIKGEDREALKNAPYCMRRARINSKGIVYYGEDQTDELLQEIQDFVGEPELKWGFDEHETRTDFDQFMLKAVTGQDQ